MNFIIIDLVLKNLTNHLKIFVFAKIYLFGFESLNLGFLDFRDYSKLFLLSGLLLEQPLVTLYSPLYLFLGVVLIVKNMCSRYGFVLC
jgi:hypothetical protein